MKKETKVKVKCPICKTVFEVPKITVKVSESLDDFSGHIHCPTCMIAIKMETRKK